MEIRIEDGERICSFSKWEGMSVCTHYDNDIHNEQIHDEEDYILDEEYYNGDKELDDYLSKHYKGEFCTVHFYRWLEFGDNTYDAGETYVEQYYVCEDGEVKRM